jgi:phytanoyl-CoA hydroxylase
MTDATTQTTRTTQTQILSDTDYQRFQDEGFAVVRGLFGQDEIGELNGEFTALREAGPIPGHFEPRATESSGPGDPLHSYPRVMHPHQVNELALRYLTDARLAAVLERLLGEEVLAAQSMFYFKPPGARGQALHQDNFYLRVEPGTCVAAWIACDEIGRDNGGLEVIPGTHRMDVFCPEEADAETSFAREYVPPPPGLAPVPVDMAPGDVLFFNGSLIHGSEPNAHESLWRRSLICHYMPRSSKQIAVFPAARFPRERRRVRESRRRRAVRGRVRLVQVGKVALT